MRITAKSVKTNDSFPQIKRAFSFLVISLNLFFIGFFIFFYLANVFRKIVNILLPVFIRKVQNDFAIMKQQNRGSSLYFDAIRTSPFREIVVNYNFGILPGFGRHKPKSADTHFYFPAIRFRKFVLLHFFQPLKSLPAEGSKGVQLRRAPCK